MHDAWNPAMRSRWLVGCSWASWATPLCVGIVDRTWVEVRSAEPRLLNGNLRSCGPVGVHDEEPSHRYGESVGDTRQVSGKGDRSPRGYPHCHVGGGGEVVMLSIAVTAPPGRPIVWGLASLPSEAPTASKR
jgi:hypothetical protein